MLRGNGHGAREEEVMLNVLIIGEAAFLIEIEGDMRPKLVPFSAIVRQSPQTWVNTHGGS